MLRTADRSGSKAMPLTRSMRHAARDPTGEADPLDRAGSVADEFYRRVVLRARYDHGTVGAVERERHLGVADARARLHLHDQPAVHRLDVDCVPRPIVL